MILAVPRTPRKILKLSMETHITKKLCEPGCPDSQSFFMRRGAHDGYESICIFIHKTNQNR